MNIEDFRNFCIQKYGVTEELPFDENTLVFKVMGKIFALVDINLFESVNLKCNPEEAIKLREQYDAVKPGYHMNKNHWNTIAFNGSISDREIFHWINHSYDLVVSKLPKKLRTEVHQNM
ncbi:MmcQ/YjbR family DNA-binding protein [Marivirga sp.]|uniref:MmcQ/YjbR family DNA-binding protein n=1 Tax=Marivirga sp. TaxID=2018662 RepID=UPI002D7F6E7F|nr:MmcQ/YjbR family DNA-binding protein [Marivirga sp.]HET8858370.1 MmcQ/YjbR family DNA-binding protein [Marivirga sp.]